MSDGIGGGGIRPHVTAGMVNTGPDVVCVNVVATPYDQSQATIVAAAVDVLPLNVQLSVFPLLDSAHVSVSVGPETPKLAVATGGPVTESTADADAPPYEPFSVADVVAPTTRVATVKDAVADPPGTVTLAGTVRGSPADSATSAPPAGAAPVSVTPPTMEPPPITLCALSEIEEMATVAVTLSVGD